MVSTHHKNTVHYVGDDKLLLAIVLGVITFWLFAQSLMNIAPAITADIGISLEAFNTALSLTALFSGCFIVVAGGLADKLGRVKMTYIGFALSIIGCLLLIFAQNAFVFSLGRVIQGLSAACIMPSTLALVKAYYEGKARQRALSFWSIGSWGGSGLCALVGGAIATYAGWRWIFILSIICAVIGLFLLKGTPENKGETQNNKKFDYMGLLLFVISLIALNLFITNGDKLGWMSAPILILVVLFLVSASLFFITNITREGDKFIDFSLFNNKAYSAATLSNFMLNGAAGTLLVTSLYVQKIRNFSAFEAGMLTLGYLIAVLAMIRVGEKILQKHGAKKPMLLGTAITGIGISMMSFTFLSDTYYIIMVFIGYILFGLGLGFYATPSTDTAVSSSPLDKVGIASGIYKMASALGNAFGFAISGSIFAVIFFYYGGNVAATVGFAINVLFCFLSLCAIALMVPANAGKQHHDECD